MESDRDLLREDLGSHRGQDGGAEDSWDSGEGEECCWRRYGCQQPHCQSSLEAGEEVSCQDDMDEGSDEGDDDHMETSQDEEEQAGDDGHDRVVKLS